MGGKSDDKSSRKMMQMQEQEAAEARAKEVARQARLDQGLAQIKASFHGAPVMGTRQVYKAGATTPGAATTTRVWIPGTNDNNTRNMVKSPGHWETRSVAGKPTTTAGSYVDEQYDTGQRTGGFGQDFYDKYRNSISDYYGQDVANQYSEAKDELTYRLADAGQLRSGVAADETADLAGQNTRNVAKVYSDADKAAAELKQRVAQEEQNATTSLYATENPDVAASNMLHTIQNLSAEKASLSPLADIFKVAAVGGANFAKGVQNSYGVSGARSAYPTSTRYGATKVT